MKLLFLLILIAIIIYLVKRSNNSKSLNNNKENDAEEPIAIMEETIKNAKRDLETGIKKDQLNNMLENGYITQEVYNEILKNIEMLEMISNFDINELKNIQNNINNPFKDKKD